VRLNESEAVTGIKVVTDNMSDIPSDLLVALNIDVVRLDVRLGTEDLTRATPKDFWCRVRATSDMATTSAPSPGAFAQAFLRARDEGFEGVCCVTVSSSLSGTFQAACSGATEVKGDIAVRVVDSRFGTMGEGLLALDAAERVREIDDFDALIDTLSSEIANLETFGALNTLEYLRRGGRIGSAQAFIGSLLSIKPIVELRNGIIEGVSRQRTRARSLRYLADRVAAALPIRRLAITHADAEDVDAFLALVKPIFPTEKTITAYMGPVAGAHLGPGTIAVCLQRG
jgi:fatty acid kinase fatty acid binding subunit